MTAGGSHLSTSETFPGPSKKTPAGTGLPKSAAPAAAPPAKRRAYIAIWQGFLGALMMFVGSIGTGWIANGSPMIRQPVVIALRTEGWGVTLSTVLLTVGAMLLMRSWLRLGQRLGDWGEHSLRSVVIAISAWSFPLLLAVPIFSRDVYAYTGQGRLVMEGQNPYEVGISTLSNWFSLGADPAWAENRTPSGRTSCGWPAAWWA